MPFVGSWARDPGHARIDSVVRAAHNISLANGMAREISTWYEEGAPATALLLTPESSYARAGKIWAVCCGMPVARLGKNITQDDETGAELLVRLYQRVQLAAFDEMDGAWAIALWDGLRNKVVLATDRFGQKQLYYTDRGPILGFGTNLGALAHDEAHATRRVSIPALASYLARHYVSGPATLLEGVSKLKPREILIVGLQTGSFRYRRQFREREVVATRSVRPDEVGAALERAIDRLFPERDVSVALSGGIDSTLIATALVRTGRNVSGYSVGFPDNPGTDETVQARATARQLGIRHEVVPFRLASGQLSLERIAAAMSEPVADPSLPSAFALARAQAEHLPAMVVADGHGADELFGGYPRYGGYQLLAQGRPPTWLVAWFYRHIGMSLTKDVAGPREDLLLSFRHSPDDVFADWMTLCTRAQLEKLLHVSAFPFASSDAVREAFTAGKEPDSVRRWMNADLYTYLPLDLLAKTNAIASFFGIRNRSPFLEQPVRQLALSLEPDQLLRGRGSGYTGKPVLSALLAEWLPKYTGQRKRCWALPMGEWLRGPLSAELRQTITRPTALIGEFLDIKHVSHLVSQHLSRIEDHGTRLWSIALLEAWLGQNQRRGSINSPSARSVHT